MALYCSASSIIHNDQKIVCALTRLYALASTYIKVYFDKVQSGANLGSWGDFAQELKISMDKKMTRRKQRRN